MSWKYLHNPDPNKQRLGLTLLAGIMFVQYWAQLFNMGETYGGGRIWSASLMFGPFLGLILPWIAALAFYYGRKLLPGTSQTGFTYQTAHSYLTHALRPMKWFVLVQLFEFIFFGEGVFLAKWDIFLVLKTLLILATLSLWFFFSRRLDQGRKGWPIFAGVSFVLGLGVAIFLFWGIFSLPIVA